MSRYFACGLLALAGASLLLAQDAAVKSGPAPGSPLPGPFDCYNLNREAQGRQHCLVCEFGLRPSVLIFAREPKEKEGALTELFKKLDEALDSYKEQELRGGVVFLSPDARSSATEPAALEPDKVGEEAKARDGLFQRLEEQAKQYKNIFFGVVPPNAERLKPYNLKAAVTVLFYSRHKVLENFAFAEGGLSEPDVEKILQKVQQHLTSGKK